MIIRQLDQSRVDTQNLAELSPVLAVGRALLGVIDMTAELWIYRSCKA